MGCCDASFEIQKPVTETKPRRFFFSLKHPILQVHRDVIVSTESVGACLVMKEEVNFVQAFVTMAVRRPLCRLPVWMS